MLPEWTLPYWSENYTGPFVSDGRFQESVANGRAPIKSKLDALSRKHDSEYFYARRGDPRLASKTRRRADFAYFRATRSMGWFPRFAGNLVLYYNNPDCLLGNCRVDGSGSAEVDGGVKMGNFESWEDIRQQPGQQRNPGDPDFLRGEYEASEDPTVAPQAPVCYAPDVDQRTNNPQQFYRPAVAMTAETPTGGEYAASSFGGAGVVYQAMRSKRRRRHMSR